MTEACQQQHARVGGIGPVLVGANAEDQALFSLNLDFNLAVLRRAVDPERPPGFTFKIFRHLVVNQGIEGAVNGCRQRIAAGDFQSKFQALVGDGFYFLDGRFGFVRAVIEIGDQANFAGQRPAKDLGDIVPMAFENDSRHDGLQQHDGRNDNDQRTGSKAPSAYGARETG